MKNITTFTLTLLLIFFSVSGCNSNNTKKVRNADNTNQQDNETTTTPENAVAGEVFIISDQIFDKTISKGIVLVDFWATWCAPCRTQGPIIEQIAAETSGKVTVCKMDIDKNPSTPRRFQVEYIPTIIIFKDGKLFEKFVGLNNKEVLMASLKKALK
jgi:thioredoxin 1